MRDPPKRQSCNQINRKILRSNYIPRRIKSNEGLAAIHVDMYGVFAWLKNKKKKWGVVASVNLLYHSAYDGCNGCKALLLCNAIIIPWKIV
jgi:hypothetical protein